MRRNIAIIDDDPDLSEICKSWLEQKGYHVQVMNDSKAALPAIATDTTDLMLVDVLMPGLDGIGFSQKVRERFSKDDVPIILMSGVYRKNDLNSHTKHLVNDFLEKPFHMETLLTKIKGLLLEQEDIPASPTPEIELQLELDLSSSMHLPVSDSLTDKSNTVEVTAESNEESEMESDLDQNLDAKFPEDDEELVVTMEESFPDAAPDNLPDLEIGYVSPETDFSGNILPPEQKDSRDKSRSWTDKAINTELNNLLSSVKKKS